MKVLINFTKAFIYSRSVRHRTVNLFAFLLNLSYVFFNLTAGIIYENILSVTTAAYYIVIVYVRYIASHTSPSSDSGAVDTAQSLLLISAFPISGIIIYTVLTGEAKEYPSWILVFLGIYSVVGILRSVLGVREALKENNPILRSAYSARLSASLMSLFNFQASLLSAAVNNISLVRKLNLILGSLISLSVFLLSYKLKRMN